MPPLTLPVTLTLEPVITPPTTEAAVVVPEILMQQGLFISTWMDARWMAALVGVAAYFWRRSVLLTILAGMAAYLPLHLGLGW